MRLDSHGGRQSAPMAEINIVPLVDVVLVLLIIFMATTAFVKESGLKMKLPAAQTTEAAAEENHDFTIALTRDNGLYLDGKRTPDDVARAAMIARAHRDPQTRVVIKGDESIPYKRVVQVMDMVKQAGLSRVALGTRLPDASDAPAAAAS